MLVIDVHTLKSPFIEPTSTRCEGVEDKINLVTAPEFL